MRRFLPILPALFVLSCSRMNFSPEEVAGIAERHSYAMVDGAALRKSLNAHGISALQAIDPRAKVIGTEIPTARHPARFAAGNLGSGVYVYRRDGQLVVANAFEMSGAYLLGMRAGDQIIELGGKAADLISDQAVAEILYGPANGKFQIKFKGAKGVVQAELTRDFGAYPNVWGFAPPGAGWGYIRIMGFNMRASEHLAEKLAEFKAAGVRDVVMDLRHNSMGSLWELYSSLCLFSDRKKVLFRSVSCHKGYSLDFKSRGRGAYYGMRPTLITDSSTSSEAEMFAASLRDLCGASIAGSVTAGNVSVTKVFTLAEKRGLLLTVARLSSPSGLEIEGRGLAPDREAPEFGEKGGMGFVYPAACLNSDPAFVASLSK